MITRPPFPAELWAAGRTLGNPRLSPDGTMVAFVSSTETRAELVIRSVSGGAEGVLPCLPPVKRAGSSAGGAIDWLPNGRGIIYLGADSCLHRLDFHTWCCRALTTVAAPISSLTVSPNGRKVAYVLDLAEVMVISARPDAADFADEPVRLTSGNDFAVDPTWSTDSKTVAWHEWDNPHMPWESSRIVARAADASSAVRLVAGEDENWPDFSVGQPRFSPNGQWLAFLSDASGYLVPWVVEAETFGNARPLVTGDDAVFEYGNPTWGDGQRSYCWVADGVEIVACRNHGGWGRVVSIEISDSKVTELMQATFTSLHGGDDALVGVSSGPTEPFAVTHVSVDGPVTIAQATVEGLASAGVDPELVAWTSDGETIYGRLYRSGADDGRLLVWVHGGPTGQSPATLYPRFSYFLERGWSILVPDYRGSTGWGRDHQQAGNFQWGKVDVDDVAAGMKAAVVNGWGRAGMIVPMGGSSGGLTALMLLALHPELCAAGVAQYPVCDLANFGESTWRYEAHYMETLVGPLSESAELYRQRSPINYADRIKAPLLVLHGGEDAVVPLQQSKAFVAAARDAGAEVEFEIYDGEGHGWRQPATVIAELKRIHDFLLTHFPPEDGQSEVESPNKEH